MKFRLIVELGALKPELLRIARFLGSDPRVEISTRRVRAPHALPQGRVLRLEAASCVAPLVSVLWGEEPLGSRSSAREVADAALGVSRACWVTTHEPELWYRTSRPLPERARLGAPAKDRPWVLVAPQLRVDAPALSELTGLHQAQPHFLRLTRAARQQRGVAWLPTRSVLASLLGHVDAVVAASGPLAWDALRAGTPVFAPVTDAGASAEASRQRLARIVPAQLVGSREFWRSLVSQLLDGSFASEWGTGAWLLQARSRTARKANPSPWEHAQRRLLKLRRDPEAFWADSKLIRWARRWGIKG